MILTTQDRLKEMAGRLRSIPRSAEVMLAPGVTGGTVEIKDEPEGAMTIKISHTLAMEWAALLDRVAEEIDVVS